MIQLETDPAIEPGDHVHIGNGRTLWEVESLWDSPTGVPLASLKPIGGYSGTSVEVARLVLIEKGPRP